MRVYFCGASSVGKTTLARMVAQRRGLRLLGEVARGVLAEREYPGGLTAMGGDLAELTAYQVQVFERQIAMERLEGDNYVSDRAMDNLAYAAARAEPGTVARLLRSGGFPAYLERVRSGAVFLVRPHRDLVRADGVRFDAEWDEVVRTDGAVLALLAALDVPYVPVSCRDLADRLRVVDAVLGPRCATAAQMTYQAPTARGLGAAQTTVDPSRAPTAPWPAVPWPPRPY